MADRVVVGIILATCGGASLALAMVTQRCALAYPQEKVPLLGCKLQRNIVWFIGLVIYGIANGFYAIALLFGPLSLLAGVFTSLLIFNMIFARWLLGEDLTPPRVCGSSVILLGIVITIIATPRDVKTEFTPREVNELISQPAGAVYVAILVLVVVLSVGAICWYEAKYPVRQVVPHNASSASISLSPPSILLLPSPAELSVAGSSSGADHCEGAEDENIDGQGDVGSSGQDAGRYSTTSIIDRSTSVEVDTIGNRDLRIGQEEERSADEEHEYGYRNVQDVQDMQDVEANQMREDSNVVIRDGDSADATSSVPSVVVSPTSADPLLPHDAHAAEVNATTATATAGTAPSPSSSASMGSLHATNRDFAPNTVPPMWLDAIMGLIYPGSLGVDEGIAHLTLKATGTMLDTCKSAGECDMPVLYIFLVVWIGSSVATLWWLRRVFSRYETTLALPVEYGAVNAVSACSGLIFYREGRFMEQWQISVLIIGVVIVLCGIAIGRLEQLPSVFPLKRSQG